MTWPSPTTHPPSPQGALIKRSKAYLGIGSWERALDDANQVRIVVSPSGSILFTHCRQAIALDSSSPWGYETKHAALHKAGDYENAIKAFEMMLSKLSDREVCGEDFDIILNLVLILPHSA